MMIMADIFLPPWRKKYLKEIETLDPIKDHLRIAQIAVLYEFPWDITRALEVALFRTFAVPSISKILSNSQQFEKHPQKRYDDTDLLLAEIVEHGYDSERGRKAIERLNFIHSHYPIAQEDYLYVLSTFVFEPGKWIERFGYRKLTEKEKIACYTLWKEIGRRMGIQNIPDTLDEFKHFNEAYEAKNFVFHDNNRKIATFTENLVLGWFLPEAMYDIGRPFLLAVMDEKLLTAFGHEKPNPLVQTLVTTVLKTRGTVLSWFPTRKRPFLHTQQKTKTYPQGYGINDLGPEKLNRHST